MVSKFQALIILAPMIAETSLATPCGRAFEVNTRQRTPSISQDLNSPMAAPSAFNGIGMTQERRVAFFVRYSASPAVIFAFLWGPILIPRTTITFTLTAGYFGLANKVNPIWDTYYVSIDTKDRRLKGFMRVHSSFYNLILYGGH